MCLLSIARLSYFARGGAQTDVALSGRLVCIVLWMVRSWRRSDETSMNSKLLLLGENSKRGIYCCPAGAATLGSWWLMLVNQSLEILPQHFSLSDGHVTIHRLGVCRCGRHVRSESCLSPSVVLPNLFQLLFERNQKRPGYILFLRPVVIRSVLLVELARIEDCWP